MNKLAVTLLLIVFVTGIYVVMTFPSCGCKKKEGFASRECPDLLVQKNDRLLLYFTNQPKEDGQNPLPFFSLDEYINYLEIQRKKGSDCPVLFLRQENDTQGNDVYRMRPSPFHLQGGLPSTSEVLPKDHEIVKYLDANRDNGPYNQNNYPGFDPTNMFVGVYTDLDKVHDSTQLDKQSDNAMDANWGGVKHTNQQVKSGKYDENKVTRPVLSTPKTSFYPSIPSSFENPVDVL